MSTLAERLNRFEAELRRMDTELRELRREVPAEERAAEAPPAATATTLQAPPDPSAAPSVDSSCSSSRSLRATRAPAAAPPAGGRRRPGRATRPRSAPAASRSSAAPSRRSGSRSSSCSPRSRAGSARSRGCSPARSRPSLVFGAGVVVRHRFGQVKAGLAAVAAGIAGGYATLAAADGALRPRPRRGRARPRGRDRRASPSPSRSSGAPSSSPRSASSAPRSPPPSKGSRAGSSPVGLAFAVVVLAATARRLRARAAGTSCSASVTAVVGAQAVWLVALEGRDGGRGVARRDRRVRGRAPRRRVRVAGRRPGTRAPGADDAARARVARVTLVSSHVLPRPMAGSRASRSPSPRRSSPPAGSCLRARQPDLARRARRRRARARRRRGRRASSAATGSPSAGRPRRRLLAVLAYRFGDLRLQLAGLAYLALAAGHLLVVGQAARRSSSISTTGMPRPPCRRAAVALAALAAALLAPATYRPTGERGVLAFLAELRAWLEPRRPRLVEALGSLRRDPRPRRLRPRGRRRSTVDAGQVALTAGRGAARRHGNGGRGPAWRSSPSPPSPTAPRSSSGGRHSRSTLGSLADGLGRRGRCSPPPAGLLATGALLRVCWRTPARLAIGSAVAAASRSCSRSSGSARSPRTPPPFGLPDRMWFGVGSAARSPASTSVSRRSPTGRGSGTSRRPPGCSASSRCSSPSSP